MNSAVICNAHIERIVYKFIVKGVKNKKFLSLFDENGEFVTQIFAHNVNLEDNEFYSTRDKNIKIEITETNLSNIKDK